MALALVAAVHAQDDVPPVPVVRPLMKDFMGLNTHTVQFNPTLYAPAFRLVRDYHPIDWDLAGVSTNETTFPLSRSKIDWKDDSGKVGSHAGLVDWQKIYGGWKTAGFEIDACLIFEGSMNRDKWIDLDADAYRYGKAFAEYFGPSSGQSLVTSVEIGNEPTGGYPSPNYTKEDYLQLFKAMARGVRDGDPKLKILTATTQPGSADIWSVPTEIFAGQEALYDALNVHIYSFVEGWPTWRRSYPEDPSIEYLKILERTFAWRDANAPGKEVWVTEFGYDASTQKPDPNGPMAKWVGVSDEVQAQWLIRSYLEFARLGVDRAYLYWFNDSDAPSFHAASGIMRKNTPKKSFWALKQMQAVLGEYRFARVVLREDGRAYVYEFVRDGDDKDLIWVAWSPTGETNLTGKSRTASITLDVPTMRLAARLMAKVDGAAPVGRIRTIAPGRVAVTLTESPIYIKMKIEEPVQP
jgi:serine/threonine-protein kinase ATR